MAHYNQNRESEFTIRNTPMFRHVCKIAKSNYWLHCVCLPTCNNSAPTGWIFMKLDIWVFF